MVVAVVAFAAFLVGIAPASGGAVKQISVNPGSLTDHECNATEWHFVITQISDQGLAPATIHVTWANGQSEDVPLSDFTGGTAHYTTTSNLDSTVTGATAVIYSDWDGTFNLSHGPCAPTTTTTPTTAPPTTAQSAPPTAPAPAAAPTVRAQARLTG
jgi:hypothetical protein